MLKKVKNWIVGHVWPFSRYQQKINALLERIEYILEEKEKQNKTIEDLFKELSIKIKTEELLEEMAKHIKQSDQERQNIYRDWQLVIVENKKLEGEKRNLLKENEDLLQEKKILLQRKEAAEREKQELLRVKEEEQKAREILYIEKQNIEGKYDELEKICDELQSKIRSDEEIGEKQHRGLEISSDEFWNQHYINEGNSGTGSYHRLAKFKAEIVNEFLRNEHIETVIEFGCGDGNQLSLIHYKQYTGTDVSEYIVNKNREAYREDKTKKFYCTLTEREQYMNRRYDMSISMDVIFHLLEDQVFSSYMEDLFTVASKYVVIYSSNHEEYTEWPEYRHRNFISYIQKYITGWELYRFIPNKYPYEIGKEGETSSADFYFFKRLRGNRDESFNNSTSI